MQYHLESIGKLLNVNVPSQLQEALQNWELLQHSVGHVLLISNCCCEYSRQETMSGRALDSDRGLVLILRGIVDGRPSRDSRSDSRPREMYESCFTIVVLGSGGTLVGSRVSCR